LTPAPRLAGRFSLFHLPPEFQQGPRSISAHARDELGFAPNQNPVFVEVTSDADWATGIAFPAGRLVNTTFESFTSDEERREAMSSLGHYPHAAGSPFAGDAGRTRSATYGVIEHCIDCTDAATRGTSIMVFPQGGGCQCGSVRYEISGPPSVVYACHCTASASTYARVLPPNRPGSLEGNELTLIGNHDRGGVPKLPDGIASRDADIDLSGEPSD
jgi:hypothetical protein